MDDREYPTSPANLDKWCRERKIRLHEGRQRFVGFVVLECFAAHRILGGRLAFKGGNALRFCYHSPRSTTDLDFTLTAVESSQRPDDVPDNGDVLRQLIDEALTTSERRFNIKTRCQGIKRNPPKEQGTHPTYGAKICYQFPEDRNFNNFERISNTVIDVEISFFDVVCETSEIRLESASVRPVKVCSLNDIVAEKLRSLLQQKVRNRNRQQDVYDIARIFRISRSQLDFGKIASFLIEKAKARGISPRRSHFDSDVKTRAELDYETKIRFQTGMYFIAFNDAWNDVISLVESLPIPP